MATHAFNELKFQLASVLALNYDLRVILCMTNTNADTENDGIDFVSELTLDEFNGTNYSRKVLGSLDAIKDDANDRADMRAEPTVYTALGAGTRAIAGALIYHHVGADSTNIPFVWLEKSITPDGNDVTLKWNGQAGQGAVIRVA